MMDILITRFLHMKKQSLSIIFWSVFPILFTWIIVSSIAVFQDQSKIPVGILLEEESEMARQLKEKVNDSSLIRVVNLANEQEARQMVATHELDSAFIIQEGYADAIQTGQRDRLIKSYRTKLSMGYTPVVEMIASFVQEDSGKAKAASTIIRLAEQLNAQDVPGYEEIIQRIHSIEESENLLFTSFTLMGEKADTETGFSLFENPWGLWAIFTLLSTFFLFDWLVKERNAAARIRFAYNRFSFQQYLIRNLICYIFGLLLLDVISWISFSFLYNEEWNITQFLLLLSYRITICMLAFLISLFFKKMLPYYISTFLFVLFTVIISGIILPMDRVYTAYPWVEYFNPLRQMVDGEIWNAWTIIALACLIIWYLKGMFTDEA